MPLRYAMPAGSADALVARDGRWQFRAPGCSRGGGAMNEITMLLADANVVDASLTTEVFFEIRDLGYMQIRRVCVERIVDCVSCGDILSRGQGVLTVSRASGGTLTLTCCADCCVAARDAIDALAVRA
jgi:hypothetical protein